MPETSDPKRRVLVVDDEEYITDLLSTSLRFQGFEVETAGAGFDALTSVASFDPDLVLMDVMMPDIDGFEVCRRMRADGDLRPVIFLTARDTKDDMLSGFTKGGDDYITKPFSLEEVVARINAVLRRTGGADATATTHSYADLVMDDDAHRATRSGEPIELSPTEWKLLRYLLMNAERVLSKTQILDHVWQYDFGGDASSVETYISYLRKKVDHVEPKLIQTVRGVGYTIRIDG
ncbi:response regulator transcription factor [Ilumatobacter coccineus]|uniref:Putative OmpR family two-component response regulator n=1 Tax=Ilumatobacter coccineus (strain NBRC 103263 / KCTC 29153 / YM16-304) TaxID=1313172 RepID=A0A6C7EEJ6_ILUCY|nr:response regulator transcription factor [Ilumatobacter coccineus]BAN03475.1 putative OmpR family two-component response regulator [Ilumatobacter coccineus YM16-304]